MRPLRAAAFLGRTPAGGLLLLVGAALLVLPGPGLLVIVAGLAVLSVDYRWAQQLRARARERLGAARREAGTRWSAAVGKKFASSRR